jgi:hypothetical protein
MRTRRLAITGLAVLTTAALAVSGCDTGTGATPSPSGSAPAVSGTTAGARAADPAAAAALAAATAKLGTTSFKITMTSGTALSLTGLMDAPNGNGTGSLVLTGDGASITVDTLLVGQDLYVRVPGVTTAGKWTHIDVARLPEGANIGLRPGQIDPANTARLLTSTTDLQQVDPRSFRGTLDLTEAVGVTGIDKVTVDGWGTAAHNVPFTAGLDDQGRLMELMIDLPAVTGKQAQPLEVLYSDYGTAVTAEKPAAGQVIEAPNELYTTLSK